jgi:metal-responsive CopG/Arc/MetJ family transcriptional regulator
MTAAKQNQLNIRVDRKLEVALDEKRIDFSKTLGYIPSRSEVVRMAIEQFLNLNSAAEQVVGAKANKPAVAGTKATKRKV